MKNLKILAKNAIHRISIEDKRIIELEALHSRLVEKRKIPIDNNTFFISKKSVITLSIAVFIFISLWAIGIFFIKKDKSAENEKIYAEFMYNLDCDFSGGVKKGTEAAKIQQLVINYCHSGNHEGIIELLKPKLKKPIDIEQDWYILHLSTSYMENNDFKGALKVLNKLDSVVEEDNLQKDVIQFYQALCYLKLNKRKQAKKILIAAKERIETQANYEIAILTDAKRILNLLSTLNQ